MVNELSDFISDLGASVVIAILISIIIIFERLIRGKSIYQGEKKFGSPMILYIGIILFGSVTVLALAIGLPIYGIIGFIFVCLFFIGLVAYKLGWRG